MMLYDLLGVRDRSIILPGEGLEDTWEEVRKFCNLRWRGMKNKEHIKRRIMEFLLKFCSGDQNTYINLRGGHKFHKIYEIVPPSLQVNNDLSLTQPAFIKNEKCF